MKLKELDHIEIGKERIIWLRDIMSPAILQKEFLVYVIDGFYLIRTSRINFIERDNDFYYVYTCGSLFPTFSRILDLSNFYPSTENHQLYIEFLDKIKYGKSKVKYGKLTDILKADGHENIAPYIFPPVDHPIWRLAIMSYDDPMMKEFGKLIDEAEMKLVERINNYRESIIPKINDFITIDDLCYIISEYIC